MADVNAVLQTKNYKQFKNIIGNRLTNRDHITRLVKEIQMRNLLATCPIIVNENMEVIDGQHRLEAAKLLGIPIFYVKVPGLDIKQVVRLNGSQRRWNLIDYVNLHIAHGNQQYVDLKEFATRHNLGITNAIILLSDRGYITGTRARLYEGDFVITRDLQEAEELLETINKFRPYLRSPIVARQDAMYAAFKRTGNILEENGYSLEDLLKAVEKEGFVIENHSRVRDFVRDFERVLAKAGIKVRLYQ